MVKGRFRCQQIICSWLPAGDPADRLPVAGYGYRPYQKFFGERDKNRKRGGK